MIIHRQPLTPHARALLAVGLVGLSAVAVDLVAVFDLVRPTSAEGNVLVWCLWVCATPVAAALAVLVARDRLTTSG
jgi:hypothetical protein